jgi:hypothetical protein
MLDAPHRSIYPIKKQSNPLQRGTDFAECKDYIKNDNATPLALPRREE